MLRSYEPMYYVFYFNQPFDFSNFSTPWWVLPESVIAKAPAKWWFFHLHYFFYTCWLTFYFLFIYCGFMGSYFINPFLLVCILMHPHYSSEYPSLFSGSTAGGLLCPSDRSPSYFGAIPYFLASQNMPGSFCAFPAFVPAPAIPLKSSDLFLVGNGI